MLIKQIFQLLTECFKIYFMYLHFIWTKTVVHVHLAQLLKILLFLWRITIFNIFIL